MQKQKDLQAAQAAGTIIPEAQKSLDQDQADLVKKITSFING